MVPNHRRLRLIVPALGLLALVAASAGTVLAQTPTASPSPSATASPAPTASPPPTLAPCPTGVSISVTAPSPATPSTVTVAVSPALNILPAAAGDPSSFHLHYFVDTPPVPAGQSIPSNDPKIIHSGSTTQDLGTLAPGSHTVWVVLGQLTHVACDARGSVTFTTSQVAGAAPTPARTGNGGYLEPRSSTMPGLVFLAFAAGSLTWIGIRRRSHR